MIEQYPAGEFTCPLCGSHYFGTEGGTSDKAKWYGHCHGGSGCTFTWHRDTEDRLYFRKTTHESGVHQMANVLHKVRE
jgi:hypothetical protein